MSCIYIHIPFCKAACTYCNFHFSVNHRLLPKMVDGLVRELEMRKDYLLDDQVSTVYFGGGTPSLLETSDLNKILQKIFSLFKIAPEVEITLEANPDDISVDKLLGWKAAGVNRLSIGVQSFRSQDLIWMNRTHSPEQAMQSVLIAKENGIDNISLDLIFALPGLSDEAWRENIKTAISAGTQHLSCYCLTVEEKTKLSNLIKSGDTGHPDEYQSARQFAILMDELTLAGFEHYEISNFCKMGYRSQHNSSYWNRIPYLGIGPSAHSFNGESRQWNISSNAAYLQGIDNGNPNVEYEKLTQANHINETLMTRLRTQEGLDLAEFELRFGDKPYSKLMLQTKKFVASGHLEIKANALKLTREGKFLADDVALNLFATND